MKIYTKMLIVTVPLAFLALVTGVGTTYYLSSQAIEDMALNWLETRLSEAVAVTAENERFLRRYGISNIASGVKKAQFDTSNQLREIEIGNRGYVFVIDQDGRIIDHPDPKLEGSQIAPSDWFGQIQGRQSGQLTFFWKDANYLTMYHFFDPWKWYILVTDPHSEVYGPINKIRGYLFVMAIIGSALLALAMAMLIRKLTSPLKLLVEGTQCLGSGDLDTRIPVQAQDELGHLSEAFNTMAIQLQENHNALKHSERYFRSLTENTPGIIILLKNDATIRYLSPSFQRILGYDLADGIGRNVDSIIHTDDKGQFSTLWDMVLQSEKEVHSAELRFHHKDGSWRILETVCRNQLTDRAVSGVVLNCRDNTLRHKVEEALKVSEKNLQDLTSRLLAAQERERRRLSIELHDEIGQSLTVTKLKLAQIEGALAADQQALRDECELAMRTVDQILEEVRRICRDLTPSALEDLGLTAAVFWQLEALKSHKVMQLEADVDEIDDLFSQGKQILIYRIFQEALANIGKHASAKRVVIRAKVSAGHTTFTIEDDGIGFDLNAVQTRHFQDKSLGLAAMSERARMLGARLEILSAQGTGTRIRFAVPVKARGE